MIEKYLVTNGTVDQSLSTRPARSTGVMLDVVLKPHNILLVYYTCSYVHACKCHLGKIMKLVEWLLGWQVRRRRDIQSSANVSPIITNYPTRPLSPADNDDSDSTCSTAARVTSSRHYMCISDVSLRICRRVLLLLYTHARTNQQCLCGSEVQVQSAHVSRQSYVDR